MRMRHKVLQVLLQFGQNQKHLHIQDYTQKLQVLKELPIVAGNGEVAYPI